MQSEEYINLLTKGFLHIENPFTNLTLILTLDPEKNNTPFLDGFNRGRKQYEKLNGKITDGIPNLIMNERTVEVFKTEGLTGGHLDLSRLSPHQAKVARECYRKGIAQHDPGCDVALAGLLSQNGIYLTVKY
jgi:hypothetical protein